MNHRSIAEQIFLAGVQSVKPDKLIHDHLSLTGSSLKIGKKSFSLDEINKIYVVGAGKATAEMARATEEVLGSRIVEGHIVVKYGHTCDLKYIGVTEAGHPVPDDNGFRGTGKILGIANRAEENDIVICLLSGGGSALLADHPSDTSPGDIAQLNDILVKSGATINEMNAVRKHLSNVKGGGLARSIFPATVISLILSDVPGDPLDVIASGPTVPDPTTFKDAIDIIRRYDISSSIPLSIVDYLEKGAGGLHPETPKPGDPVFKRSVNILVGTNKTALKAAAEKAYSLGYEPLIVDDDLRGDSCLAARNIVEKAVEFRKSKTAGKPGCLLFGGETTLKVTRNGLGGRNQHLALAAALLIKNIPHITILSGGTDGNDGPTDAAGAVVDSETVSSALLMNIDPEKYLSGFDSYNFFKRAGGHVITGPTLTNVMDMVVTII